MNAFPPKSQPNSSIAVTQLRDLIFSGKLGAGTDHLESELAQALGMSRTPVREAVLMLEAQGLLEVRPRKGVRIKPVSPSDMAEIYDVLTEL
jgi:DNA-binding GntR family transcriptional regulator